MKGQTIIDETELLTDFSVSGWLKTAIKMTEDRDLLDSITHIPTGLFAALEIERS